MDVKRLFDLKVGNRFYFLEDRTRKVWQVDFIEETTRINSFSKEETRIYVHLKNDLNVFKKEKTNKQVVFIRNIL